MDGNEFYNCNYAESADVQLLQVKELVFNMITVLHIPTVLVVIALHF